MNYEYSIKSPCKINLSLDVHEKREDGFHNLTSIFQLVSLEDTIKVVKNRTNKIKVFGDFDCKPEDNLIYKAANSFLSKAGIETGLSFTIEKVIPFGGGVGGGSGNCAAVLRLLDVMFKGALTKQELFNIGLKLGSDVPFFLGSGTALVQGRGEKIMSLKTIEDYHILLVNPGIHISTKEAFKRLREKGVNTLQKCKERDSIIENYTKGVNYFSNFKNSFEIALYSDYTFINDIKMTMYDEGALLSALSGSGSTMFGIFDNEEAVDRVSIKLSSDSLYKIFKVKPIAEFPTVYKREIM